METQALHSLPNKKTLEQWVLSVTPDRFPRFDQANDKSYPDKYREIKKILTPIHRQVEKGALLAAVVKWRAGLEDAIRIPGNEAGRDEALRLLVEADPLVYLTGHGAGHVEKVIAKATEILHVFPECRLTPYEGFLLLCAIQVHDVGNFFGREHHEMECRRILDKECRAYLPDSFERKVIERIAVVHGGAFGGNRDTIGQLRERQPLNRVPIRKQLLAGLLRLSDELADDHERADVFAIEHEALPPEAEIYHQYSRALHPCRLEKDANGNGLICLHYEFYNEHVLNPLRKAGRDRFLLDEIYDRTLKAERERRYCMRFLRPCVSIDRVSVEILIENEDNCLNRHLIRYTLEENGYPGIPESGSIKRFEPGIRSGDEERQFLIEAWGIDA
jgi:hypothetical protein